MSKDLAGCRGIYESWRSLFTIGRRKFVQWGHRILQVELIDSLSVGIIHGLAGAIHFAERMASLSLDLGETILPILCEAITRSL